jgi:prepilin-type N-terminal cleavage/methylation domain-containing protein
MVKGLTKPSLSNQKGFTLVEVMIALTIFAVFISTFLMSQGTNISNSILMMEDITLHNLAESKMNEIILNPPVFTNGLENSNKSKNFKDEGYKKYKYTIEYKKLEIPDLSQLMGQSEEDNPNEESRNGAIKKMVFKKLKLNIERILWQVKVTITNTETDYGYELTSWITNTEAQLDTNFGF